MEASGDLGDSLFSAPPSLARSLLDFSLLNNCDSSTAHPSIFQPSPTTTSHLPTTSTPTPTSVAAVFFLSEICQLEKTFNTYLFFLLGCIQLRQPSLSCVCQIARQNFQRTPSSINQHAYPPSFIHSAHTARALCCNIPKFDKSLPVLIHQGSLQAVASYRSP